MENSKAREVLQAILEDFSINAKYIPHKIEALTTALGWGEEVGRLEAEVGQVVKERKYYGDKLGYECEKNRKLKAENQKLREGLREIEERTRQHGDMADLAVNRLATKALEEKETVPKNQKGGNQ